MSKKKVMFLGNKVRIAQAYIDAHGNLSAGEQLAIITFTNALNVAGIWDKLHILYPCIGTVWGELRLDLKDPTGRQMIANSGAPMGTNMFPQNSGKDLTFPSWNALGVDENNVSNFAFIDTLLNVSSRYYDSAWQASNKKVQIGTSYTSVHYAVGSFAVVSSGVLTIGASHFISCSSYAINSHKIYIDNVLTSNNSATRTGFIPDLSFHSVMLDSSNLFLKCQSEALNETEQTALYNAVLTLNTALSR